MQMPLHITTLSAAGLPDRAVPSLLLARGVGAAHDRPRGRVDRLQPLVPGVRQRLQHAGRLRHVSSVPHDNCGSDPISH